MSLSKVKRQHTDRTLKEKIEILGKLDCGVKAVDLCKQFNLSQSTLSTWKKQRAKLNEMVDAGKVLNQKRNRESFLPQVERALHLWFCEMRSKPHAPPINQSLLVQKATYFAKEFGRPDWEGYGSFIHRWTKRYGIVNKAICGSKESAAPQDQLETWKETVLLPTLARYSPNDIYNGDETALFYKSLPHRTYCFDGDKPAGSAKRKDRLTLLIITNMDGSDHRKLSVIGKAKTPRCLQKKYKMQVKDMSVDWYASKNAWMTGEIHHKIMSKLNNEMRLSNRHILYVCDNASSHQVREYSHIKFLMLPPNATSIMQPLDQGIILSAKRRYKKKLAERYLACVENNKDANSLLKALDIVQATNMIAASWRETSPTIIQNCFRKAGFKHHAVDPTPPQEEPLPAPAPDVWNRVQRWLGDVQFDDFAASEPEASTAQPMSDQDIVHLVLTENDVQEESDDESEEDIPSASAIKTSVEFLAMIDQQKAFLKRNDMSTEIVEQLEAQVVAMQFSLCNKQKQMQDYFTRTEPRSHTPFKSVVDVSADISIVESLDTDDMELESIDTTVASVATSVLMKETPTQFSTPKRSCPPASQSSTPPTPAPKASTSTATASSTPSTLKPSVTNASQPPAKRLKLGLSRPPPKILSTSMAVEMAMNGTSSSGTFSSIESDSESASSQQ